MDLELQCRCLFADKASAGGLARDLRGAGYAVDLTRTGLDPSLPWDLLASRTHGEGGSIDATLAHLTAMTEAHGGRVDGLILAR